jgi:hypothetical protein
MPTFLAFEIGGCGDARCSIDPNIGMAEHSGGKNRDCDEAAIPLAHGDHEVG